MSKQKTWLGKNAKKPRKNDFNKVGQTPLEIVLNVLLVLAMIIFAVSISFAAGEIRDVRTDFPGKYTAEKIRDDDFQQVVRSYINSEDMGEESDVPEAALARFAQAVYMKNAAEKVGDTKLESRWAEEEEKQETMLGRYQDKADAIREVYSFD